MRKVIEELLWAIRIAYTLVYIAVGLTVKLVLPVVAPLLFIVALLMVAVEIIK